MSEEKVVEVKKVEEEKKEEVKKEEVVEEKKVEKPKKFDLIKFMYHYNNKDDTEKVCNELLFDQNPGKTHSFWVGKLKDDLTKTLQGKQYFMNANRIGGWFRYIEKLKNKAFCSAVVIGDTDSQEIHMLWICQGKKVSKDLKKDTICGKGIWHDCNWTKLEPTKEEDKKLIMDYLLWNDIGGKTHREGKIF